MTLKPKVKNTILGSALLILGGLGGQGIEYGVDNWQYLPPEKIPLELNVIATELSAIGDSAMKDNPFNKLLIQRDLERIAERISNIGDRLSKQIEDQKQKE